MSKQKWYIIKDTNTCEYWDGSSDTDCWTQNINFAHFFYDKNDAIHTKDVSWDKDKFNDDCQVIELCEDDEDYQELKEENEKLKQQLAEYQNFMKEYGFKNINDLREEELIQEIVEKDKEIEFAYILVKSNQQTSMKAVREIERLNRVRDRQRHQICEEIRKRIVKETCYDTEEEVRNAIYDFNAREVLEILDQIEKGE